MEKVKEEKRKKFYRYIGLGVLSGVLIFSLSACKEDEGSREDDRLSYQMLVAQAEKEGKVESLAMPDEWANWEQTWSDLRLFYGLSHTDTDMNSAQELEKMEGGRGDIGDVGYSYAVEAERKEITEKYKTSYWEEIPDWAKDEDGDYVVAYTGTLAFMVKDADSDVTMSWEDLLSSEDTVGTSDVCTSSQAQYTVYAAALALGGSRDDIQPGIAFFKTLAEEGRLSDNLHDESTSIESEIDVNIKWDFIALSYRDTARERGKKYGVCIPSDGSVTVGYASIINKNAKHPAAAKLAREYILSDAGQLNLAAGYATPIRSIVMPEALEKKRVDRKQYNEEMIEAGLDFTEEVGEKIAEEWKKQVIPVLNKEGRAQ